MKQKRKYERSNTKYCPIGDQAPKEARQHTNCEDCPDWQECERP